MESCEFVRENPHEWRCTVHDALIVAGTEEPVYCPRNPEIAVLTAKAEEYARQIREGEVEP